MATLVCFHAHPDDEASLTGGSMARAAAEGHRVVLVVATDGRLGEAPGDLAPGETLIDRRRAETERSLAVLGGHRVVWLGYGDSGMTGWPQNHEPGAFAQADLDEAAERLADVLREERAEVLTTYDWHGNYGHPDHVMVHRVGHRAAELAGTPHVFEATMNRDHLRRLVAEAAAAGEPMGGPDEPEFDPDGPADDGNPFGMPEADITHLVDVSGYLDRKREALACHASQVTDIGFFLQMAPDAFAATFGQEYYIGKGAPPGMQPGWLFDGTAVSG
jgi:LmbE family N-acetylglucosaminyl deacetylase